MIQNQLMMKYILAVSIIIFSGTHSFGKGVTARIIKVIPRSASIETEISPILLATAQNKWKEVDQRLGENASYENKKRKFRIESGKEELDAGDLSRYRFYVIKGKNQKEAL